MTELSKTFDPAQIEARWYAHWEANGLFRPERPDAEPWTIVNPPPNVTGSLHIGHALDNTLQDILTRHARMRGKDARWVVGMDHAGIATQMVVERQMAERQQKRTHFSRDEFVAKVWEWKDESGGAITKQLRRLGCSMDWANERFTMDEGFSKAVLKVFVDLYNQGLIYRDKRLVNWDPGLGTAISDLEVETREVRGSFWQIRYPLADDSGSIVVATTRPETMLADMAVAVHPEDERYRDMIGKQVRLPITGRLIPIVVDEHADPALGSGAVKITPGHDFNDFEVGKRAGFKPGEMLNMFDAKAQVVQVGLYRLADRMKAHGGVTDLPEGKIPDEYIGKDRFHARQMVVERLKADGVLVPYVDKDGVEHDAEPRTIQTPFGDRSGEVIEPWLTDQWYVDAETLAKRPIKAVRSGAIKIVPKTWEKTFFNWMENIQPWCVSRQLWWGHRIPAWFGDDGKVYVALTEEEAQAQAGPTVKLEQDPDVLDTWFSSALWPFATLGWPDDSQAPFASSEVEKHGAGTGVSTSLDTNGGGGRSQLAGRYPNDILISGFDILFFWDARMMMQGMHFMGEVPFRTLYLHGLVRAPDGQKMSKSKGNVVDPLGLIDKYGADALRFFMAAMESQGRDIKMDEKRVEGYRNFATKLWNAARFCQANGIGGSDALEPPPATLPVNRWIVGETVKTVQALDLALAELRFDESANTIYHFTWATFCDWYLELIKGQIDAETRAVAGWVLDQILVMLHPFMPFVTEELWGELAQRPDYPLITARWPMADAQALDPEAGPEIDWLIRLVSGVRTARAELNVPPGAKLALHISGASAATRGRIERNRASLQRLARIESVSSEDVQGGAAQVVIDEATYSLPLEGVIDIAAEKARLQKAAEAAEKERDSLAGRLNNASFLERAKPEAVEKARADHAEKASDAQKYRAALARLG